MMWANCNWNVFNSDFIVLLKLQEKGFKKIV